eukprot:2064431-Rhodomonas_salina.2
MEGKFIMRSAPNAAATFAVTGLLDPGPAQAPDPAPASAPAPAPDPAESLLLQSQRVSAAGGNWILCDGGLLVGLPQGRALLVQAPRVAPGSVTLLPGHWRALLLHHDHCRAHPADRGLGRQHRVSRAPGSSSSST